MFLWRSLSITVKHPLRAIIQQPWCRKAFGNVMMAESLKPDMLSKINNCAIVMLFSTRFEPLHQVSRAVSSTWGSVHAPWSCGTVHTLVVPFQRRSKDRELQVPGISHRCLLSPSLGGRTLRCEESSKATKGFGWSEPEVEPAV